MEPERLSGVVHTGLQTLLLMAAGWAVAHKQLLKPAATADQAVSLINMLVMRVCLPALQLLLLGVHTDMRTLQNWRLLCAFMVWTAVVQAGCGVWVLLFEGGSLERWGLHALVLAANNTGILAPVVLDAALGTGHGYIGMLATVCLYFQQLPASEALMAAGGSERSQGAIHSPANEAASFQLMIAGASSGACLGMGVRQHECARQLYEVLNNMEGGKTASKDIADVQWEGGKGAHPGNGETASHMQCQTQHESAAAAAATGAMGAAPAGASCKARLAGRRQQVSSKRPTLAGLLGSNPLVWTTGIAAALSAAGSCDLLSPASPHGLKQLAFVAGSLEWLARCSVPLTLLSTGLWLSGRMQQLGGANTRLVVVYLLLKLFALPWLMLGITSMMGIDGKHGLALLLLTVVPVGQTAFVISERYQCGTEAVTATLIAGLLVMLPHLLLVLWAVDWLGLYNLASS